MSQWRTSTVLDLCRAMRQEREYSAAPILADALQDADYGDEVILSQLRHPPDGMTVQKLVALVYSDETAHAVKKIEEIAGSLSDGAIMEEGEHYGEDTPMTYERLMRAANRWIESDWGYTTENGGEAWRDQFPGLAREFWEHYEIITGDKPRGEDDSFFSCSC